MVSQKIVGVNPAHTIVSNCRKARSKEMQPNIVGSQINSLQRLIEITLINKKSILFRSKHGGFECHSWKFIGNTSIKAVIKMLNDGRLFELPKT